MSQFGIRLKSTSNIALFAQLVASVIRTNAAGFFGLHIITAGSYSGEEHTAISESGYKNLFIADNKLKGFILMGDMINNAGIYTSLVREQTPLNEVDLALLLEKPALMAFPAEYRKEKLGGQR